MNTTKNGHTPGPWRLREVPALDGLGIACEIEAEGHTVALVHSSTDYDYASLLLAAPDLLAALKRLELHTAGFERTAKMTDQFRAGFVASLSDARAAIAKATTTKTS